MAESILHLRMKERTSWELAKEGYRIFVEPAFAPSSFLTWSEYRPDIVGVKLRPAREEYAIVECETRPSARKLDSKNFRSVEIQGRINSEVSLRRILVVPRGTLGRFDSSVRRSWETWIYEGCNFQRLPMAGTMPR